MITLKVRYKVGYKLYQKIPFFSEKRLDFQAFQKSGLEPVARAKDSKAFRRRPFLFNF